MADIPLSQSTASFAVDLLSLLSKDDENSFCSPLSIAVALAMTYGGAGGVTATQLKTVLFKDGTDEGAIHAHFTKILAKLNDPQNEFKLHTANRLFAQKSYAVYDSFLALLKDSYHTTLELVDFETASESARLDINKWVADTTNDKIKDLLAQGVLNALTKLVIVNAIYFKGTWQHKFKANDTHKHPFHVTPSKELEVDMMNQKARFRYGENDELACQVLGMPYRGNGLAMFVLLPKERFGLVALQKKLTGKLLLDVIGNSRPEEVVVKMPKFKMEHAFDLKAQLAKLGLTDMFDEEKADFSRIAELTKPRLQVTAVIHKAFVEVNEEGTEAAAATAVVMGLLGCAPPSKKPIMMVVDHPFLFALVEESTQSLLFLGKVVNP